MEATIIDCSQAVYHISLTSDEHWIHKKYISPNTALGIFTGHKVEHIMVMILSPFF